MKFGIHKFDLENGQVTKIKIVCKSKAADERHFDYHTQIARQHL